MHVFHSYGVQYMLTRAIGYDYLPGKLIKELGMHISTSHVPSNDETFHMINHDAMAQMKDGVIIINTARGSLIDSEAFIANLKSGKIGGAGLDVIENEAGLYYCNRMGDHIDNDELAMLRSFPNVIVSPHTAFYVETTVSNMVEKSFIALDYFRRGELSPFEIKL